MTTRIGATGWSAAKKGAVEGKKYKYSVRPDINARGVLTPRCYTCFDWMSTVDETASHYGVTPSAIYRLLTKGLPFREGVYANGRGREGTHGITQRFICTDESDKWATKNKWQPQKGWLAVLGADGETIEYRAPAPTKEEITW